jgi:pimeloyl-ACP methyl ester carboxylesterase
MTDIGGFTNTKAAARYFAAYDDIVAKWPLPYEGKDVTTRFGTVRVRRSGVEGGVPVVLLSPMGGISIYWYGHIASLGERYQLYTLDSLGEGGRSVQTTPFKDNKDVADWLVEVLDGLGLERAHVVGYSRGGWLGLNFATRWSERLASLTVFDPPGFGKLGVRFVAWLLAGTVWLMVPPLRRRFGRFANTPAILDKHMFALLLGGYRPRLPATALFTDDELRSISAPTQVILGGRSAVHRSQEVAARIKRVMPDVRVEIVPGASHAFPTVRPDLLDDYVQQGVG